MNSFSLVSLECLHLGDIFAVNQRAITILERPLHSGVPVPGLCGGSAIGFDDILARDGMAVPHPFIRYHPSAAPRKTARPSTDTAVHPIS